MIKFFRDFVRDESGAAAAEYALILAIVGAGIAGAAWALGDSISQSMGATAGIIDGCAGANASETCDDAPAG